MTISEALEAYRERFGDAFPLMCRMGVEEQDIIDQIVECLEDGTEAVVDYAFDY